ncbi:hypothetical protein ABZR86_12230 [Dyella marensis]|jgi:hypothetical protein|uniref:Uncharacterized protein n=1 Tax=Dyella marensis TaxID=500610 RepID=A0A1I2GWP2_9GAMM|nr:MULTISPECIES: hypothetical protein [Dyella]SFF21197.1 hypothetical protein SAMN02799615_02753 [Dyella marensis]
MNTFLILLSSLLWWVLYSSIGALFVAIIAWAVLRWIERCPPVFNRTYLACLLWMLLDVIVGGSVLMKHGAQADPLAQLHTFGWRAAIVLNMLIGAGLLWRLVPRIDARRIKPTSACLAVAVIMLVAFGAITSLQA